MNSTLDKQTAAVHAVFKYDIARHVKHVKICAGRRLDLEKLQPPCKLNLDALELK